MRPWRVTYAALRTRQELVELDPGNAGYRRDVFISTAKLGLFAERMGDLSKAIAHFEAMVEMMTKLVAMDPANAQWKQDLQNATRDLERLKAKAAQE